MPFVLISLLASFVFTSPASWAMPETLREGMMTFALGQENYLKTLILADDKVSEIKILRAMQGYNLREDAQTILQKYPTPPEDLDDSSLFLLGKAHYFNNDCIKALQYFKAAKKSLRTSLKQQWMYYSSECFIALDSPAKSVQILNQILDGRWAAYGYYNLAMKYAERNKSKSKALNALKIAKELNPASTEDERELLNRINFAAGSILFEANKSEAAKTLFNDIYLDSDSAPQALYMNGLVHLELNDFRGATQLWNKAKPYPIIHPGVAESALAVPYAFERAGYTRQAMEAYIDASRLFEDELKVVDNVIQDLGKVGFQKAIVQSSDTENVEWFLAQGISKNTTRAAYYSYLMRQAELFDLAHQQQDLLNLKKGLEVWRHKLSNYNQSLSKKRKASNWKLSKAEKLLDGARNITTDMEKEIKQRTNASSSALKALADSQKMTASMARRVEKLIAKERSAKDDFKRQINRTNDLKKQVSSKLKALEKVLRKVDQHITQASIKALGQLRKTLASRQERSELGLLNILEQLAIEKQSKVNPLDRRYQ